MDTFKWLTVITIFLTGLAAGCYPLWRRHKNIDQEHKFPLAQSFATGIFLAVGLIHMLPDASELFKQSLPQVHFPIAALFTAIIFLVLLLIEHLAMNIKQRNPSHRANNMVVYLLTIMLVIHSFLMGLALGAETSIAAVTLIFIGIIAHKSSASFALSVSLSASRLTNAAAMSLFGLFITMTPLGIILGADINHYFSGDTGRIAQAVFFSLAAGTFLYMSTLHGLKHNPMIEYCCNMKEFSIMALGFALMALVRFWV